MRFLLDENADHRLIPFLKQLGHDVTVIAQDYSHGLLDQEVLAKAVQEKRIRLMSTFGDG